MRSFITQAMLLVILLCCVDRSAPSQEHKKGHAAADLNKQFQKPDLDVNEFIRRFETDSREIYAQRQKIVEAIELHAGMSVADIGSGTGLFAWLFASKVGTRGKVYTVEIAPAFIRYITDQATRRGLDQVVKQFAAPRNRRTLLPGRSMLRLSVPRTTTSSTRGGFCHQSIRRSDWVEGWCSSTSISARTAAISSVNEHAPPERSTSGRSRTWASHRSRRSTRSI